MLMKAQNTGSFCKFRPATYELMKPPQDVFRVEATDHYNMMWNYGFMGLQTSRYTSEFKYFYEKYLPTITDWLLLISNYPTKIKKRIWNTPVDKRINVERK